MSTYKKFTTLATAFLTLAGFTCNSKAADIFDYYDVCKHFFDHKHPVTSTVGEALRDKNFHAIGIDDESKLVVRVSSGDLSAKDAKQETHYTEVVKYFFSSGRRGDPNGGWNKSSGNGRRD